MNRSATCSRLSITAVTALERPDDLVIEPARPGDGEAIAPPGSDPFLEAWWRQAPETFRVVRDADGAVRGYSSLCLPHDVPRTLLRDDPVAQAVLEHVRREPVPPGQRILIHRWSHGTDRHATATLWLDTKRAYLELRPRLRRLYVPAPEPEGGARGPRPSRVRPPRRRGPAPRRLAGRRRRPRAAGRDRPRRRERQLVLDGHAVDLSRLELDVLRHPSSAARGSP